MTDPFATPETPKTEATPAPAVEQGDNWVSFTFLDQPGYDRVAATVHGEPSFVASLFGIQDFDGKISTLMKQSSLIDLYFKQLGGQGKA